jgi:hypothetical protein
VTQQLQAYQFPAIVGSMPSVTSEAYPTELTASYAKNKETSRLYPQDNKAGS